jgi:hypothetical protein
MKIYLKFSLIFRRTEIIGILNVKKLEEYLKRQETEIIYTRHKSNQIGFANIEQLLKQNLNVRNAIKDKFPEYLI